MHHDEFVKAARAANMRGQALCLRRDGSCFTSTIPGDEGCWPTEVTLTDSEAKAPSMWPPPSGELLNGHLIERLYKREAITSTISSAIIYAEVS